MSVVKVDFELEQQIRSDIALAELLDARDAEEPAEALWQCDCGSVIFHITDTAVICASCDTAVPND